MAKYLKSFNTHSDYLAFTQTANFVLPNVSYCVQQDEVHYTPAVTNLQDAYNRCQLTGSCTLTDGERSYVLSWFNEHKQENVSIWDENVWIGRVSGTNTYNVSGFRSNDARNVSFTLNSNFEITSYEIFEDVLA